MESMISIIIVGQKNIEKTIESINKQIYKNIEIFIFGNKKGKLVNKDLTYVNDFSSLKKSIKGNFISIINSGDYIGVDYYRQMIDKAIETKADIVMGNTVFDEKGNKVIYNLLDSSIPDYLNKNEISKFINKDSLLKDILIFPGNKIYTKSLFTSCCNNLKGINDLYKRLLINSKNLYKYDIDAIFHSVQDNELKKDGKNFYYSVKNSWNPELEKIKIDILSKDTKYVSFDVFDTLILRPFLEPIDELTLLNDTFAKMYKKQICTDFKKIRIEAENYSRAKKKKQDPNCEDVTIDEIYDSLVELFGISEENANKLKKLEIQNEIKYCRKRKTAYQIYKFAKYINKKVIIISDMYLLKNTIKEMLDKCGFTEIYKYYISSELRITKAKGTIYKYVLDDLKIKPENLVHIGDNWTSDWKNAKELNINSKFLPRTINVFYDSDLSNIFYKSLPFYEDNTASTKFMLIRIMIAEIANKYYDNPYKLIYNKKKRAIFNTDVKLFGYAALGMHLFGLTKWMLDDLTIQNKKYDKINFLARDGYLPQKAFNIMKQIYDKDKVPNDEYFYISRKALIPIIFATETNIDSYTLVGSINVFNHTPIEILKYLDWAIKYDEKKIEKICDKLHISQDEPFEYIYTFLLFLKEVKAKLLNKEQVKNNMEKLNRYFNSNFEGKSCVFDIGYSARDEEILSKYTKKPIDAYFLNINEQTSFYNAKKWDFKIKTYLNYKPSICGSIREILISKQAPSCIKYDCSGEEVKPVFEDFNPNVDSENIINIIQNEAIKFIENLVNTFGKTLNDYEYYDYYTNLPLEVFINSPKENDKLIIKMITFEDDVGMGNDISLNKLLDENRKEYNQKSFEKLFNEENNDGIIKLNEESKKKRAIYYAIFRHDIFNRRIKEILNNILKKIKLRK